MVSPAASQQENSWYVCMLFLYLNGLFPGSPSNDKHAWLIRDSKLAMEKRFFREVLNKEPYECMIKYI